MKLWKLRICGDVYCAEGDDVRAVKKKLVSWNLEDFDSEFFIYEEYNLISRAKKHFRSSNKKFSEHIFTGGGASFLVEITFEELPVHPCLVELANIKEELKKSVAIYHQTEEVVVSLSMSKVISNLLRFVR